MGKYDDVIDRLQPMPIADLKYQEKVEAAKTELLLDTTTGELTTLTPEQLAEHYAKLRALDAAIDAERYALQVKMTALEQLIVDSWDKDEDGWGAYGAGPNTVRLRNGYAIDVEPIPEGKVEDAEAFRRWCVAPADRCMVCGGQEDALGHDPQDQLEGLAITPHTFKPGGGLEKKLQLWPSTMNAIAKERCLAGTPPPDGVAVYLRTKIKLRKA